MTADTRTIETGIIARRTAPGLWWASVIIALPGLAMSVLAGALEPDDAIVILYLATGALGMWLHSGCPTTRSDCFSWAPD